MSTSTLMRAAVFAAAAMAASVPGIANAGSEPFIGEIQWTANPFCPNGWADADGRSMAINTNTALFSLLGTNFGGDGLTTFNLPDLRGRTSVHVGQGPGLSPFTLGQKAGQESVTLQPQNIPSHTHTATTTLSGLQVTSTLRGSTATNTVSSPAGAALGVSKKPGVDYVASSPNTDMAVGSVESTVTGGTATTVVHGTNSGTAPVPLRNPSIGLRACIALQGIYPSRP